MDDRDRLDSDDTLHAALEELRRPLPRAPGAVDAIVRAVRAGEASASEDPGALRTAWAWLTTPRVAWSPLRLGLAGAAVAAVVLLLETPPERVSDGPVAEAGVAEGTATSAGGPRTANRVVRHQFVLLAPEARSVSVVGDFNGWRAGATPLRRAGEGGTWVAEVQMTAGRHLYSFVIDGERWVPDLDAPRAPEDDFGRPSSVLLLPTGIGT